MADFDELFRLTDSYKATNEAAWEAKQKFSEIFQEAFEKIEAQYLADMKPFQVANKEAMAKYKAKLEEVRGWQRKWVEGGGVFGEEKKNGFSIPSAKKYV